MKNPNVLQVEEKHGYLQQEKETFDTFKILCPHCSTLGMFYPVLSSVLEYIKALTREETIDRFTVALRQCPNSECRGLVLVAFNQSGDRLYIMPPEKLEFKKDDIPADIAGILVEAIDCESVGAFRAAGMLVRRFLEAICVASGADGRNLHDRLKRLREKVTLSAELFDAMDELKLLGNDSAHIISKDYDTIGREEATLAIEIAKEIAKSLYQQRGLVDRLRSLKK